jgi:hypothetical protein
MVGSSFPELQEKRPAGCDSALSTSTEGATKDGKAMDFRRLKKRLTATAGHVVC